MTTINIEGYPVKITNPEKILWPKFGIRKIDYIKVLMELASYMIPHTKNRLLTTIRYPDGVKGKSFFQKNIPSYAPNWIETANWKNNSYILLNNKAILAWLGNQAALEFHTAFNIYNDSNYPDNLVFDLDPSEGQSFEEVGEVAIRIHETLLSLNINSWVKTSGATGLQIYIPIGKRYDYNTARKINEFFGTYFSQKYPKHITIERMVKKRGKKLYFDYLQMWQGKTITSIYSPRARENAPISMPVTWEELSRGNVLPKNFNLLNAMDRLKEKGDLFSPLINKENIQNLDFILKQIKNS